MAPIITVRERLLDAATLLIDEGARWTWSTRDFCSEAALNPNAFHRQFSSRSSFVTALVERWRAELDGFLDGSCGKERLARHFHWLLVRRARLLFLVAESLHEHGLLWSTPEIVQLCPDADDVHPVIETRNGRAAVVGEHKPMLLAIVGLLASVDDGYVDDPDATRAEVAWRLMWRLIGVDAGGYQPRLSPPSM